MPFLYFLIIYNFILNLSIYYVYYKEISFKSNKNYNNINNESNKNKNIGNHIRKKLLSKIINKLSDRKIKNIN